MELGWVGLKEEKGYLGWGLKRRSQFIVKNTV